MLKSTFEFLDKIFHHEQSRLLERYKLWNAPDDEMWISRGETTPTLASTHVSSLSRPQIPNGRYRHFKNNWYVVIGLARMIGEPEWYVVYRPLVSSNGNKYFRLADEFTETVERSGQPPIKRFTSIGNP